MSAIGAILSFDPGFDQSQAVRRIMDAGSDLLPNGSNIWEGNRIGLSHSCFCTTPEDVGVSQPLADPNDQFVLSLDGRIDNRAGLYSEIQQSRGQLSVTASDAEMFLCGYRCFGTEILSKVVGEFAVVIWDGPAGRLLCARDPMGSRPLVFHYDSRRFIGGTLLRQVLSLGDIPRKLSRRMVADYLSAANLDPSETFFADIRRVPAGHWLEVRKDGHVQLHQYWNPSDISLENASDHEIDDRFRESFFQAVTARVRTTWTHVAIQVSGGLDSSCVAAAVHEVNDSEKRGLTTIALQNIAQHPDANELEYQRCVLAKFPMVSTSTLSEDYWSFRDPGIDAKYQEEPFEGDYAARMVAEFEIVNRLGAQVILTGNGGDEIGGNSMYLIDRLLRGKIWGLWSELTLRAAGRRSSRRVLIRALAQTVAGHLRRSYRHRSAPPPPWINPSFTQAHDGNGLGIHHTTCWNPVREDTLQRLQHFWIDPHYSAAAVINHAYRVETRHPFLDRRVVEWALSTPAFKKGEQGYVKAPIRRALSDLLPESIVKRRDKGNYLHYWDLGLRVKERSRILHLLTAPISADMGFVDANVLRDSYMRYCEGEAVHRRQLWNALTFEKWLRNNSDCE